MAHGTPHTPYVVHHGLPQLKGANNWFFLYYSSDRLPTVLQLKTQTYGMKEIKQVLLSDGSVSYMRKVTVGTIHANEYDAVLNLLSLLAVVHSDVDWNYEDWIVDSLELLKECGHDVLTPTSDELAACLEEVDVSS